MFIMRMTTFAYNRFFMSLKGRICELPLETGEYYLEMM